MNTRRLGQGGLQRGRLAAMLSAALIAVAGFSSGAAAQMLTTLYTFTGGIDGGNPYGGLIADATGNLSTARPMGRLTPAAARAGTARCSS